MKSLNELQREINEKGTATISVTLPVHIIEGLRSSPPSREAIQYAANAMVEETKWLPSQLLEYAIAVEVWIGYATQSYEEFHHAMRVGARSSTTLGQLIAWIDHAMLHTTSSTHKMLWAWGSREVDLYADARPKMSTMLKQMGVGEEMHVSLIEKPDQAHILEGLEKMGIGHS
ncbi:hypothetical protein AC579_8923 [Pseudocercospora musae]|uniref:Uncharacterized protein n=1 Tax=Pseudocercospora musae TaxID=113226 RepID=A0A139HHD6_9PEZI|nr:hypothetical protein AC579_8923 [Pseudocercospora musae]